MKLKYGMWTENNGYFIIEDKTEEEAHKEAVKLFGINGFWKFERYYGLDGKNKEHKDSFIKRGISNITKHIHKENRKGFKIK